MKQKKFRQKSVTERHLKGGLSSQSPAIPYYNLQLKDNNKKKGIHSS
jgi:hypothetical protein